MGQRRKSQMQLLVDKIAGRRKLIYSRCVNILADLLSFSTTGILSCSKARLFIGFRTQEERVLFTRTYRAVIDAGLVTVAERWMTQMDRNSNPTFFEQELRKKNHNKNLKCERLSNANCALCSAAVDSLFPL